MASEFLGVSFTLPAGLRLRHIKKAAFVTTCHISSLGTARAVLVTSTAIYINDVIHSWLKCALLSLDGGGPVDECRSEESAGALQDLIDAASGAQDDNGDASDACLSCAGAPTVAPLCFRAYLYFVML